MPPFPSFLPSFLPSVLPSFLLSFVHQLAPTASLSLSPCTVADFLLFDRSFLGSFLRLFVPLFILHSFPFPKATQSVSHSLKHGYSLTQSVNTVILRIHSLTHPPLTHSLTWGDRREVSTLVRGQHFVSNSLPTHSPTDSGRVLFAPRMSRLQYFCRLPGHVLDCPEKVLAHPPGGDGPNRQGWALGA